jgi:hypothetical protein
MVQKRRATGRRAPARRRCADRCGVADDPRGLVEDRAPGVDDERRREPEAEADPEGDAGDEQPEGQEAAARQRPAQAGDVGTGDERVGGEPGEGEGVRTPAVGSTSVVL